MSMLYRLMYRFGFAPWDRQLPTELADIITGPSALPPGRALDMGSGLGTKAIFIATRGWQVTAVESVLRAMAEARQRASKAGVRIDFRKGDVTRLDELGLQPGYNLVFDFGCYHGLKTSQRDAYVRGVKALAGKGATLLMMGFTKPVPPVTAGVTEEELTEKFGRGWKFEGSQPVGGGSTAAMSRGDAAWFRMTRLE